MDNIELNFFDNTGGTGFLGKILIEKLLRSCSGISTIYVLVRPKKGQDVLQRIENLFEDPVSIQKTIQYAYERPLPESNFYFCYRYLKI